MEVCEMECYEGDLYILAVNYLDRCMCIISRQNDHLKYLVPLVCLRLQTSHLKSSLHIKNGYLHPRVGAETTVAEDGEKGSQFPEMEFDGNYSKQLCAAHLAPPVYPV